jgi:hypothetical protein
MDFDELRAYIAANGLAAALESIVLELLVYFSTGVSIMTTPWIFLVLFLCHLTIAPVVEFVDEDNDDGDKMI